MLRFYRVEQSTESNNRWNRTINGIEQSMESNNRWNRTIDSNDRTDGADKSEVADESDGIDGMGTMHYRRTRIYQRSLELVELVAGLQLPVRLGFLADQLRRAAASVTLNYLEGCGRDSPGERRRFFAISIGSANEVAGGLQVAHSFEAVSRADLDRGQDLCDHLASMLRRFH